ncbi:hypothetical protein MPER_04357, partial [Moniliophthora perniciosa FA553]
LNRNLIQNPDDDVNNHYLNTTVLDVFTDEIFSGNPLAIVHLSSITTKQISAAQKQGIAKEYNLAETVFLHEPDVTSSTPTFPIDIFDTTDELPFAGHPTIGTGWYLLQKHPKMDLVIIRTKAGDIPVRREGERAVRLRIPIEFTDHGLHPQPELKASQCLGDGDYRNGGGDAPEPVASIVKGMTFILVELSSEEALVRVTPLRRRPSVSGDIVGDWHGFTAVYFYVILSDGKIRARMFDGPVEDPATGSAASTLAVYLARKWGTHGTQEFYIVQGVEMGRRSEIGVRVDLGDDAVVQETDELVGRAATTS